MNNKEKLKDAIKRDINLDNCYDKIINKITKKKNNLWKLSFIPICLIIVLSLLLNFQSKVDNTSNKEHTNTIKLNINDVTDISVLSLDYSLKKEKVNNLNIPYPFKMEEVEPNIPNDLDSNYTYIVYGNENLLNNYIITYTNNKSRTINIKYSKDKEPFKDYYFNNNETKITTINNVDLKIYKYKNEYFALFSYNGYNFDIEASITEQELSEFLISILK